MFIKNIRVDGHNEKLVRQFPDLARHLNNILDRYASITTTQSARVVRPFGSEELGDVQAALEPLLERRVRIADTRQLLLKGVQSPSARARIDSLDLADLTVLVAFLEHQIFVQRLRADRTPATHS